MRSNPLCTGVMHVCDHTANQSQTETYTTLDFEIVGSTENELLQNESKTSGVEYHDTKEMFSYLLMSIRVHLSPGSPYVNCLYKYHVIY